MPKIIFNGQEYDSLEAMPPDVRQLYERMTSIFVDKDGNNVPDLLEGAVTNQQITSVTQYIVDGKVYSRLEDLPPELRERYTAGMAKLDANQNSIPDVLEGNLFSTVTSNTQQTPPAPAVTNIPTVQIVGDRPGPSTMRMVVIGLIILAVVAIIVYFSGTTIGR